MEGTHKTTVYNLLSEIKKINGFMNAFLAQGTTSHRRWKIVFDKQSFQMSYNQLAAFLGNGVFATIQAQVQTPARIGSLSLQSPHGDHKTTLSKCMMTPAPITHTTPLFVVYGPLNPSQISISPKNFKP